MKCACPKCHADVQLDNASVSENGVSVTCAECKTHFYAYKESFACRALRKADEITCLHCGSALDHTQFCPACGVVYPDYIFASVARKQVRKIREKFSLKESLFPGPVVRKGPSPQIEIKKVQGEKSQIFGKLQKYRSVAIGLLVLLVVVAAGAYFYLQNEAKQKYATDYVRALYGMKMGADLGLKACAKLSSDWKANLDSGRSQAIPRISADDETRLVRIKGEVDAIIKKSVNPPQDFQDANKKLTDLYDVYQKIQSLAVTPAGSQPVYAASTVKLEADFKKGAAELKGALPKELADEFKVGQLKYKGLRDF